MGTEENQLRGKRNRKRGISYEYEVMKMFKEAGYQVQRTAGSHSEYDIMAWKKAEQSNGVKKICFVAFIQCKTKKE